MRHTQKPKKKSRGGLCGIIVAIVVIAIVVGIFSSHTSAAPNTDLSGVTAVNTSLTATDVSYQQTAVAVSNSWMTNIPTDTPVAQPTDTPTPKPQPTHQATPRPTPRPTQPPTCQAINGNPWCDNFNPGNLIYNPPSNFCDYFNCIASFWGSDDPGDGYVVECADSTFSQSGGERGACSSHGGVSRPLYSH